MTLYGRSLYRAKIPASKEPLDLTRSDGKRPEGVTLIPWSNGKCLTWDVTVPDKTAASHVEATSTMAGAAADKAASNKKNKKTKYSAFQQTHLFVPVSVGTMGSWNVDSITINFVSTIGKKLTEGSGDPLETSYLFQRLSVAISEEIKFRLLEPCRTLTVRAHMPLFLLLNSFLWIVFDNNKN